MMNLLKKIISRRVRELEAKIKELEDQLSVHIHLKKVHLDHDKWEIDFGGEFIPILAAMMYQFFKEAGGQNYVEMRLNPKVGCEDSIEPMVLTLQRVVGKTPHELRRSAEEEVVRLKLQIQELEKKTVQNA